MSDLLTAVEIEGQHVEVLPARIVLSWIDLVFLGGSDAKAHGCDGGKNYAANVNTSLVQNANGCDATATGGNAPAGNTFRGK